MDYLVMLSIGFALGFAYHALAPWRESKTLSLQPITRYEFTPPVRVEPTSHREQWCLWTHHYIALVEALQRERGAHHPRAGGDWLPSYRMLRDETGQTWRTFKVYDDLLAHSGVIAVVGQGGRRWRVRKPLRRKCLSTLPYPFPTRPPRFDFTVQRDSVTGVTAFQEMQ
jgi:hypothetical protein